MNHVRAATSLASRRIAAQRVGQVSRRTYTAEPASPHPPTSPPNPNSQPPKEPSRVGAYYGTFGSPILKCFLGALFTYQIAYYAWLKLETIEETHVQKTEVKDLQQELREAIAHQKENLSRGVDEIVEVKDIVVEQVREGKEEVSKATGAVGKVAGGGWWPW